jgi:hypothetical protein
LKKVGAWTMEEVYETRFEELDQWISENKKKVSETKEQLRKNPKDKTYRDRLKKAKDLLAKHLKTRSQVKANQASSKWL